MRLFLLSVSAVRSLPGTQHLDLQLLNPLGEPYRLVIRKPSRDAVIITAALLLSTLLLFSASNAYVEQQLLAQSVGDN
jgi:hypothetical protein